MTLRQLLCWFGWHGETVRESEREGRYHVRVRVRCLSCGWVSEGILVPNKQK